MDFEINAGEGKIREVLNIENHINYVAGYSFYDANNGNERLVNTKIFFNLNFNGLFNTSYELVTKDEINFQIKNYKLGHTL